MKATTETEARPRDFARLVVELNPELYNRVAKQAAAESSMARKTTIADVIRTLIMEHLPPTGDVSSTNSEA